MPPTKKNGKEKNPWAHFGPKRVPSERRTDMARPLERKTTAMALREGKGRAMSDNI